jgi:4'-phosphopantetheinyl transferase
VPAPGSPSAGEVSLWLANLAALAREGPDPVAWLSPDEKGNAARFVFERDRRAYIAARGALRAVLAASLELHPAKLELVYGPQGKPHLASRHGASDLHFNLSHSGDWALIGLTRNSAIGVDVERIRNVGERALIADRFFAPAERTWIEGRPPQDRLRAFFRVWTRKEACLKATGRGLWADLHRFCVSEGGDGWSTVEVPGGSNSTDPMVDLRVNVRGVPLFADYEAAVAIVGPHDRRAVTCRALSMILPPSHQGSPR